MQSEAIGLIEDGLLLSIIMASHRQAAEMMGRYFWTVNF